MIRKAFYLAALSLFVLTACGESNSPAGLEPISTPAPVPAEYAGKTNPFGPEAAGEARRFSKPIAKHAMDRKAMVMDLPVLLLTPGPKTSQNCRKLPVMIICSGVLVKVRKVRQWLHGKVS